MVAAVTAPMLHCSTQPMGNDITSLLLLCCVVVMDLGGAQQLALSSESYLLCSQYR
jgi:hypothetical protein